MTVKSIAFNFHDEEESQKILDSVTDPRERFTVQFQMDCHKLVERYVAEHDLRHQELVCSLLPQAVGATIISLLARSSLSPLEYPSATGPMLRILHNTLVESMVEVTKNAFLRDPKQQTKVYEQSAKQTTKQSANRIKLSDVKVGDKLRVLDGFSCMPEGVIRTVSCDPLGELFIPCDNGQHMLDSQLGDDGEYLDGLVLVTEDQADKPE